MDNVSKILNFINSQQEPTPQEQKQESIQQKPKEEKEEKEDFKDSKLYNSTLRKINKISTFPNIINGKIINSADELLAYKTSLQNQRKQFLAEERKKKKDSTKLNLETLPTKEDTTDLIEEDNIFYKRGNIEAIRKDDRIIEIPKTNKKDRKILMNKAMKDNKIKELTQAKDEEEFKNISSEVFKEPPIKEVYEKHISNDINPDKTWSKDDFIKEMLKYIDKKTQPIKNEPKSNYLGLNLYNLNNKR